MRTINTAFIPELPSNLYRFTAVLGLVLLLFILYLMQEENANNSNIHQFNTVLKCQEQVAVERFDNQKIASVFDRPTQMQAECWKPAKLPENNPARQIALNIEKPSLSRIWYRVNYELIEGQNESKSLMIYIPRIMAYAWQIKIDGRAVSDSRYQGGAAWNQPAVTTFLLDPDGQKRRYTIDIGVIASEADGFSMSRVSVGDAVALRKQESIRQFLQVILPEASGIVLIMLFPYFLLLWLARQIENEFLLLASTCLVYGVTNLRYAIYQFSNVLSNNWLSTLIYEIPGGWLPWLIYLSVARFFNYHNRLLEWLLWFNLIFGNLTVFLIVLIKLDLGSLRAILSVFLGFYFILALTYQSYIRQDKGLRIVVLALLFSLIAGVRDTAVLMNFVNPESFLLNPYSSIAFFIAFFYAIQLRYVAAIEGQETLNGSLTERLAVQAQLMLQLSENEVILRDQQQRLLELERTKILEEERQRLMHDMHDGLGSSLLTTLAAVETNKMSSEAVAEVLRICVEDLRLVIDSLEPTSSDLVTLLGTIRYRIGQRLDSAGIKLLWEVGDLPLLAWLDPPDALNVLRLLQEALVNVLKHANATTVRVVTKNLIEHVEISIIDNGKGFNPATIKPGRGLHNQVKRVQHLGGLLKLNSIVDEGTSLRLILPVNKTNQAATLQHN